ncbi:hypothetical protein GJ744_007676 [Endocarpon pusillum]|uniref:Uncharacterized protein n=1 Tax=Endocarpon pusillum TaxID=364733 RepID=A0A8H7E660_9EURO|nr:hypothetical protein GJ744_007676 [Endocarpon pusillum]
MSAQKHTAFTMIPMRFLLFTILMAHAKPLPADLDKLAVPPDFMTARQCPEDRPLIDCFHPHFGLVYGPQAGKAIYRAKPGIGSDLKAGQTSNAAEVLSLRGSTTECVFFHGACHEIPGISGLAKEIPAEATGEHTESGHEDDREDDREDHNESHGEDDVKLDKHTSNSATAHPDRELAVAPSDEDAVETDTKTLTKRRAGLNGFYMDCGNHELTSYCYAPPRNLLLRQHWHFSEQFISLGMRTQLQMSLSWPRLTSRIVHQTLDSLPETSEWIFCGGWCG